MAAKLEISIRADGITIETENGFGAWSKKFLSFDYEDWRVYIEANEIDHVNYRLTLQFTDDGKILLSCNNHLCNDNEEYDNEEYDSKEIEEDANGCCEYKNFEITDSYTIQNDHFFIRFVKNQKNQLNKAST
jgi:hypothetical protein